MYAFDILHFEAEPFRKRHGWVLLLRCLLCHTVCHSMVSLTLLQFPSAEVGCTIPSLRFGSLSLDNAISRV